MAERGITTEDVDHALSHAIGGNEPGAQPGTIVTTGWAIGGRRLKVVRSTAVTSLVISVYWVL